MIEFIVNEDIKFKSILVIAENGEKIGVMNITDAIDLAYSKKLDLVCVNKDKNPAICKIMDYGKYKFDMMKREKQSKKNSKVTEISELQLSYVIQENDMRTKAAACKRLISKGNHVKIVLRLKGREISFIDAAKAKVEHFIELCGEFASVKNPINIDGRDIRVTLIKKEIK